MNTLAAFVLALLTLAVAYANPISQSVALQTPELRQRIGGPSHATAFDTKLEEDLLVKAAENVQDLEEAPTENNGDVEDYLEEVMAVPEGELGLEEDMEGAENVVFRPLFVHRQRQARNRGRRSPQSRRQRPFLRGQYRPFRPRPVYLRAHQDQNQPLQILY